MTKILEHSPWGLRAAPAYTSHLSRGPAGRSEQPCSSEALLEEEHSALPHVQEQNMD